MSDAPRPKFRREEAVKVAKEIATWLEPVCDRLIIAGSLRRRKQTVSDVEVLFIPQWGEEPDGLFDKRQFSKADRVIERMVEEGILEKRKTTMGSFTWGSQNKFAIHAPSRIPVDFFATDQNRWWVAKVIRTGGKKTNLALTTGAIALGRKLHAYGSGFTDRDGSPIVCHSEEEVFQNAGVSYREPWDRE